MGADLILGAAPAPVESPGTVRAWLRACCAATDRRLALEETTFADARSLGVVRAHAGLLLAALLSPGDCPLLGSADDRDAAEALLCAADLLSEQAGSGLLAAEERDGTLHRAAALRLWAQLVPVTARPPLHLDEVKPRWAALYQVVSARLGVLLVSCRDPRQAFAVAQTAAEWASEGATLQLAADPSEHLPAPPSSPPGAYHLRAALRHLRLVERAARTDGQWGSALESLGDLAQALPDARAHLQALALWAARQGPVGGAGDEPEGAAATSPAPTLIREPVAVPPAPEGVERRPVLVPECPRCGGRPCEGAPCPGPG